VSDGLKLIFAWLARVAAWAVLIPCGLTLIGLLAALAVGGSMVEVSFTVAAVALVVGMAAWGVNLEAAPKSDAKRREVSPAALRWAASPIHNAISKGVYSCRTCGNRTVETI
jgi:hypothetical protein